MPVYRVSVELPNAARLSRTTRSGSAATGSASSSRSRPSAPAARTTTESDAAATDETSRPARRPSDVVARLNLKLDKAAEPLPQDSIFRVRYRSSFGLKYLEITRGDGEPARRGLHVPGHRRRVAQTEFDDIDNTFDTETRDATRAPTSIGFGDAFAGRGTSLNQAIEALEPAASRT